MTARDYVPDAGDLVWMGSDPSRGREQAGWRSALVVSAAGFSLNTGLAVVCPISSGMRLLPTSIVLPPGLPVEGEILISHLRSIDVLARGVRYAGAAVPGYVARLVRARVQSLVTI